MPSHTTQEISPYSSKQLFDMIVDIEKYPEFLPWCRAARIIERGDDYFLGELIISFKHFTESYVSRVTYHQPLSDSDEGKVNVVMEQGPFEFLENHWKLIPQQEGGTLIDFHVDFRFKSKLLEGLIGGLFGRASAKMGHAFKVRADTLYAEHK